MAVTGRGLAEVMASVLAQHCEFNTVSPKHCWGIAGRNAALDELAPSQQSGAALAEDEECNVKVGLES